MKIRDNQTGKAFEYGADRYHALRISENGGYSFVLDDGKTPEESISAEAVNGAAYANIGGFHGENRQEALETRKELNKDSEKDIQDSEWKRNFMERFERRC